VPTHDQKFAVPLRLNAPIELDIGARMREKTAISICTEIIALQRAARVAEAEVGPSALGDRRPRADAI
jgi:xanthine/CO dehydrogenase XdhC/CoxF family maturation factor